MINGIEPTYQTIESGLYPVSRPMYIYVKKPHLKLVQNTKAFKRFGYFLAYGDQMQRQKLAPMQMQKDKAC